MREFWSWIFALLALTSMVVVPLSFAFEEKWMNPWLWGPLCIIALFLVRFVADEEASVTARRPRAILEILLILTALASLVIYFVGWAFPDMVALNPFLWLVMLFAALIGVSILVKGSALGIDKDKGRWR